MELINKKENIFGDDIAFVEQYDFSTANLSEENRIKAITTVASICYQNPKAIGSESLYNRLLAESQGLPSSSFEFVPILIDEYKLSNMIITMCDYSMEDLNIYKYGEKILNGKYLLTNYRAVVYDVENGLIDEKMLEYYNTQEECEIIKQHFKVFKYKVDLPTRSQMVRHRVSWQELSRRYVSGKRKELEFYISDKMKKAYIFENGSDINFKEVQLGFTIDIIIGLNVKLYYTALDSGIKPEEARRILPQGLYTEIWGAYQPKQLDNFFKLRLDKSAQKEIRLVAEAMQELIV